MLYIRTIRVVPFKRMRSQWQENILTPPHISRSAYDTKGLVLTRTAPSTAASSDYRFPEVEHEPDPDSDETSKILVLLAAREFGLDLAVDLHHASLEIGDLLFHRFAALDQFLNVLRRLSFGPPLVLHVVVYELGRGGTTSGRR